MAVVGNDTLWMDPTCNICPFGELPWGDENINTLVVTDTGGVILKSPASSSDDNQIISKTHLYINDENNADIKLNILATGNIAQRFRKIFSKFDKDEIKTFIKENILSSKNNYNVLKWNHENIENINQPFILEISANLSNPIKKLSNEIFVQPPFLQYKVFKKIGNMKEDKTISFNYPKSVVDSITIEWADSFAIDSISLPKDNSIHCTIGKAKFSYVKNNQSINISAESHVMDYYLPSAELISYKEYLQSFTSLLNQKVIFITNK